MRRISTGYVGQFYLVVVFLGVLPRLVFTVTRLPDRTPINIFFICHNLANLVQLSPRIEIDRYVCITYVETYLLSYHTIYFCEAEIYFAMIHIAPNS